MSNSHYTHRATLKTVSMGGYFKPTEKEIKIEKNETCYKYHNKDHCDLSGYGDYNFNGERVNYEGRPTIIHGRRFTLLNIEPLAEKLEIKKCCMCHKDCTDEEEDNFDEDGERVCDDCYVENNYEWCEVCGENIPNEDMHEKHFIYENELYEILSKPFYMSDGFSMSLFDHAVKKIKKLSGDYENSDTICTCCVSHLIKEQNAS